MKKVVNLIKVHKLSSSEVIQYLSNIGVQNASLNTRIDTNLEQKILNHFFIKTTTKNSANQVYKVENPELITVFSKNIFARVVQEISHPNYKQIKSYFSDEQAKHICFKMSNKNIRYFSNLFITKTTGIDKLTLRYQIHYLANKALTFYGGKILTFIYELKNWAGRKNDVEVLKMNPKSVYDVDTNFPKLHIQSYENNKSYTLTFTRAYERFGSAYFPLKITNNYSHKIARVSINGQLIDDFENCIPEIAIFKESIGEDFMLFSGYDDDFCDNCQKRLTDPISIKYGMGPTCRKDHGIP